MWVYEPYRDFEERARLFGNLWKTSLESEKKTTCGKQRKLPLNHEFIRGTRRAIQMDGLPGPSFVCYSTYFRLLSSPIINSAIEMP